MPLSSDEYREVLRHLGESLESAGLGHVVEYASAQAMEADVVEAEMSAITQAYLRSAIEAINRRSRETYDRALEIFHRFIRTEDGGLISDVSLVATDRDREFLGFDEISLMDAPETNDLVQGLREISMVVDAWTSTTEIKDRITEIFQNYTGMSQTQAAGLIPSSAAGKIYEAYVLSLIARDLVIKEGCSLQLSIGSKVVLKSSPGPINPSYPCIQVRRNDELLGQLWTDIEFISLSYWIRQHPSPPTRGEFHELDVVMTTPGATGRPTPDQILIGAECKDTLYQKRLLREILGVRRELSLLRESSEPECCTVFHSWPRKSVPATPPSCLLVYSTSPAVTNYSAPGDIFGIDFNHEST